jgi:hypothetical protein
MAEGLPRVCIFGDSHYACLKQAEVQGLVDARGVELEYWGHVGSRFRHLEFRDGAIHPLDDFTALRFAKFNARGRTFLPAAEFEAILVMGARVYLWRMFLQILTDIAFGPFVSEGLQRRILTDGLRRQQGYRLAKGLAGTGTARVVLAPVAYYTFDPARPEHALSPEVQTLIPRKLPEFWAILEAAAAEDGIRLLRQPEETVSQGMFTEAAYAVPDYLSKQDFEHHNAAYGAIVLARMLEFARKEPRRDALPPEAPLAKMMSGGPPDA